MVRDGILPAVRREGCWHVAAADLISLGSRRRAKAMPIAPVEPPIPPVRAETGVPRPPAPIEGNLAPFPEQRREAAKARAATPVPSTPPVARSVEGPPTPAQPPAEAPRSELLAVLEMLAQRDAHIADLQNERARLYAQLGLLQGVLAEREGWRRPLEAQRVARPRQGRQAAAASWEGPEVPQGSPATGRATVEAAAARRQRDDAGRGAPGPAATGPGRASQGREPDGPVAAATTVSNAVQKRVVRTVQRLLKQWA